MILPPAPIVVHKEIDVARESSPSSTIGDPLKCQLKNIFGVKSFYFKAFNIPDINLSFFNFTCESVNGQNRCSRS